MQRPHSTSSRNSCLGTIPDGSAARERRGDLNQQLLSSQPAHMAPAGAITDLLEDDAAHSSQSRPLVHVTSPHQTKVEVETQGNGRQCLGSAGLAERDPLRVLLGEPPGS